MSLSWLDLRAKKIWIGVPSADMFETVNKAVALLAKNGTTD